MAIEIRLLDEKGTKIAELAGEANSIKGIGAVMNLLGEILFLHKCNLVLADRSLIDESFFDLKSGFAGELTQKISNYRMKLAITGRFNLIENLALKAFIYESNLGKTVRFASNRDEAMAWLSRD
jgi:hypothetical protein